MAYTSYGEFVRIQRLKHHEVMGDTAKMLGVSIPFVSAVENGKKNVPDSWPEKLIEHFDLNEIEQKELKTCIEQSKTAVKIDLKSVNGPKREMAVQFQRSFDDIDEDTARRIIKLLNRGLSE